MNKNITLGLITLPAVIVTYLAFVYIGPAGVFSDKEGKSEIGENEVSNHSSYFSYINENVTSSNALRAYVATRNQ